MAQMKFTSTLADANDALYADISCIKRGYNVKTCWNIVAESMNTYIGVATSVDGIKQREWGVSGDGFAMIDNRFHDLNKGILFKNGDVIKVTVSTHDHSITFMNGKRKFLELNYDEHEQVLIPKVVMNKDVARNPVKKWTVIESDLDSDESMDQD